MSFNIKFHKMFFIVIYFLVKKIFCKNKVNLNNYFSNYSEKITTSCIFFMFNSSSFLNITQSESKTKKAGETWMESRMVKRG